MKKIQPSTHSPAATPMLLLMIPSPKTAVCCPPTSPPLSDCLCFFLWSDVPEWKEAAWILLVFRLEVIDGISGGCWWYHYFNDWLATQILMKELCHHHWNPPNPWRFGGYGRWLQWSEIFVSCCFGKWSGHVEGTLGYVRSHVQEGPSEFLNNWVDAPAHD